jgi:thiamine-monophosphate kinase
MHTAGEFALIETLFAPLTLKAPGAFDLLDDVAFLEAHSAGHILTVDQIIEGTHFLTDDPLDLVARKLVRRNLSDLIAKGARPVGALLTLAWPVGKDKALMADFARGLGEDLASRCNHCPLLGGDTSQTDGPMVASLTLIGVSAAPSGMSRQGPVLRRGARAGDVLFVTGQIGLAHLGLKARLGQLEPDLYTAEVRASLLPDPPPLEFGAVIAAFATASIDVSDGLLADMGHILTQSGVHLDMRDFQDLMEAGLFPAERDQGARWSETDILGFVTGGDDYQTVCSIDPAQAMSFLEACAALGVKATILGTLAAAKPDASILRLSFCGKDVALPERLGWSV